MLRRSRRGARGGVRFPGLRQAQPRVAGCDPRSPWGRHRGRNLGDRACGRRYGVQPVPVEGLRESGNYPALHLTSHRFDEPRCLGLLSGCDQVIAIHGCRGAAPQALLGGLDRTLTSQIGAAIAASGIEARLSGHQYPAVHPENICNRGRRGAGVQIELTTALRLRPANEAIVTAIRSVLLTL